MSIWTLPVAVVVFLTWLNTPPSSLGDAAQREALRRQFLPQAAQTVSNANLPPARPAPEAPVAAPPTTAGEDAAIAPPPDQPADLSAHDEKWWHDRINTARDAVDHDQMAVDALQSQINALTRDFINRDDPGQKSQLEIQRNKALAELDRAQKQLATDTALVATIMDEARRAGVPPGWLRGGGTPPVA
jgi:hypothetical protein